MSKKVTIKMVEVKASLSEIYQKTGYLFSFVTSPKNGNKQCHQGVKCRDFLHDAVSAQLSGKSKGIYGFKFDNSKPEIDMNRMRMLVTKEGLEKAESLKDKLRSALKLINHFEGIAGVQKSRLLKVNTSENKEAWLFVGPAMWMRNPYFISLYTFLIRLGDKEIIFENKKDLIKKFKEIAEESSTKYQGDNDASYLKTLSDKLHLVVENREELFGTEIDSIYTSDIAMGTLHNQSGILSLCKARTGSPELNKKVSKLFNA